MFNILQSNIYQDKAYTCTYFLMCIYIKMHIKTEFQCGYL